jgi:hypothetical protein
MKYLHISNVSITLKKSWMLSCVDLIPHLSWQLSVAVAIPLWRLYAWTLASPTVTTARPDPDILAHYAGQKNIYIYVVFLIT